MHKGEEGVMLTWKKIEKIVQQTNKKQHCIISPKGANFYGLN